MERIARLASYACRVGLDLPSSYVRLEWELDGFDGPISYCTVLCCSLYIDGDGDGDGDGDIRKQQEEKDIVTCIPPFIYPRLVVEKIYTHIPYTDRNEKSADKQKNTPRPSTNS